ncbi:MAG: carbamoyltransferase [Deltaproteobacteria bacterium]|nr:carbamoyltransferase [Deltaproteobacteria bacterium]
MNVIGISAFYHESSCCLLQDGKLVAAVAEERFTRVKHDASLPLLAFRYCLEAGGIGVKDVDAIGYYESPRKKLSRQLWTGKPLGGDSGLPWLDVRRPEREIRQRLGFDGPIDYFDHHLSHAASSYFFSGFPDAAVLTVDGVGEWATTTYGAARGGDIALFEQVDFPNSLGLLYSTITGYLGFRVNSAEYKVMGLAPYGKPLYVDKIRELLTEGPDGQYALSMQYFDFLRESRMYSDALAELFGEPPRVAESAILPFHKDVAKSLQVVLEEILLAKARYLKSKVDSPNLCMAGGVALNCVANGRVLRDGPFDRLFVQPAAGDSGACLGAAALSYVKRTGKRHSEERLQHVYLGPAYSSAQVAGMLEDMGIEALDFRGREAALLEAVVDRMAAGHVIGWFQGAMEFGPRALGARSIIADPRFEDMRERLNRLVKKREAFRPFAPSVLEEHAGKHFALDHTSPFMLETCQVSSSIAMPAITHVDGSARPQTVSTRHSPRYAALIEAFYRRTGCPVIVNTSFNVRSEPIVCSPDDALMCMANSDIDSIVVEDFIIDRAALPRQWSALLRSLKFEPPSEVGARGEISPTVYTFF